MTVVIVPTGTANTASVLAAFRRLGVDPAVAGEPEEVDGADRVILPGVGSFGAAVGQVDRIGLRETLTDRILEGRPTLAVCVGMQLLARRSQESDGVSGLALIDQEVRRFPERVRVPQLGWNLVEVDGSSRFIEAGWAYFANSYRFEEAPPGWTAALADHGGTFVSALERDDVLACQFHPELSGAWGSALLARWLGQGS